MCRLARAAPGIHAEAATGGSRVIAGSWLESCSAPSFSYSKEIQWDTPEIFSRTWKGPTRRAGTHFWSHPVSSISLWLVALLPASPPYSWHGYLLDSAAHGLCGTLRGHSSLGLLSSSPPSLWMWYLSLWGWLVLVGNCWLLAPS